MEAAAMLLCGEYAPFPEVNHVQQREEGNEEVWGVTPVQMVTKEVEEEDVEKEMKHVCKWEKTPRIMGKKEDKPVS